MDDPIGFINSLMYLPGVQKFMWWYFKCSFFLLLEGYERCPNRRDDRQWSATGETRQMSTGNVRPDTKMLAKKVSLHSCANRLTALARSLSCYNTVILSHHELDHVSCLLVLLLFHSLSRCFPFYLWCQLWLRSLNLIVQLWGVLLALGFWLLLLLSFNLTI